MTCKYLDCGWCYAPTGVKTNNSQGECIHPECCPYFKSQMTFNTEIQKTEKEIAVLQAKLDLLKEIEIHKSQPKMKFLFDGKFEVVSYNKKSYYRFEFSDEIYWYRRTSHETHLDLKLERITDGETHRLLDGLWFNGVKRGKYDEQPTNWEPTPQTPEEVSECLRSDMRKAKEEVADEVEWDEKDTPNLQKIIDKMVEERKSKKLRNMLKVQLDYDGMVCDDIVDIVEDWLPEPQSAAGSQNVDTELLVDGFNHCLQKIKEMLR